MLEDLVLYHGLTADGDMNYSATDLREAANKHQAFVLEYFTILDADGNRQTGTIQRLDISQIDTQLIAQKELMQRYIGLDIAYELIQDKPEFLTFVQNFGGDQSSLPAIMDVHVVRDEHFQESAQLASRRPHTVRVDWSQSSDAKRETLSELRQRRKEQFKARLGISSYSGLYSFLYITRFAVRHEILIPLLSLEQWVPMKRESADFLEVSEQARAEDQIKDFFQSQGSVVVNGQHVKPKIERVNFFGLDINDFALNAEPRRVSVYQARVGVIISFPCITEPKSASIRWDNFSDDAPFIDSVILIGSEKPDRFYFHPKATEYTWEGSFASPSIKPVEEVVSLTDSKGCRTVAQGLLSNIYRAFDFREDGDVYDALASSIQGDLLRDVYLRFKRSLLMAEHGGEISRAEAVEVTAVNPSATNSNEMEVTWQVNSTTEHWGHIHKRSSEYRASMALVIDQGFWKIEKFQLLDEKRLQFETSIRGYDSNR